MWQAPYEWLECGPIIQNAREKLGGKWYNGDTCSSVVRV